MNDLALTRYLRTCCRRLQQQQAALVNSFALRTCQDIELRPASGTMSLDLPGRGRAIATVTPIARYCPTSQIWRWSWAGREAFKLHGHSAIALQSLGDTTGLKLFSMERVKLSLEQTLPVLAMACHQLRAGGYYRWADGNTFVLMAINHMALAAAPLHYSNSGDRFGLSPSSTPSTNLAQESQQVRPSPSLLGEASPVPDWPMQRDIEGFFAHLLSPQLSLKFEGELAGLTQVGARELFQEVCN